MNTSGILEIRRGDDVRQVPLTQQATTIGRSSDNQVVLDDELVSRHHAVVEWTEGTLYISDLGSSNGTLVNGAKIGPGLPLVLTDGDVISTGGFTLTVRLTAPAAEKVPPPAAREKAAVPAPARVAAPSTKIKLPRGKPLISLIAGVIVLIAIIAAAFLLVPESNDEIVIEAIDSLMQMNTTALDELDAEIDKIVQEQCATEEMLLKLEQVVKPALEWAEYQKELAKEKTRGSSWIVSVDSEELDKFKNDQYQVTKLEMLADKIGTEDEEFSTTIEVTDLTATVKEKRDWESIDSELKRRKTTIEQRWQTKVEKGQLSITTFTNVIESWENWEVQKLNKTTYSISGNGLGWAEELTAGKWTYYRDRREIIPADKPATALKKILTATS